MNTHKALLVISFGTSFGETREKTITATENDLAKAFPDYVLRRAFASHHIIKKLIERDGLAINSVPQAIERLLAEGYREVIAQPLQVINGIEFHQVWSRLHACEAQFSRLAIGCPLLTHEKDYADVIEALRAELPHCARNEAVVLMGHGSQHPANASYAQLDYMFKDAGCPQVYIGTMEGYPRLEVIMRRLEADGIRKVNLLPFMLVAGEHAQNDMAGEEAHSWKMILQRNGYVVSTRLLGLGEIEKIRQIYVAHARAALENEIN